MAMRGLALAIMIIACPSCMALVHPPQHRLGAAERAVVAPLGAATGAVVSQQLHRTRAATAGAGGTLEPLRGGGGLAKKLGLKNVGMLMVLLSLLYLPRAMSTCSSRMDRFSGRVVKMGCGSSLTITNGMTLCGLGLVLANSRQFDRHGRSKLKMRLNGSLIVLVGMIMVVSHSEAAQHRFASRVNANLGLLLEWWGFVSLFYNFTPRFVAQIPRELGKLFNKLQGKAGMAPAGPKVMDAEMQQKELDRLNRWAQSQP